MTIEGSGTSPRMRFSVLGPLDVTADGVPRPIRSPKQRALLAALLISPGRVVPASRLLDELWPEGPPPTATAALQVHVAGLRRIVGACVRTSGAGYLLRAAHDDIDWWRFESLLRQARAGRVEDPGAVVAYLREALDMWRGAAFEDVPGGPRVHATATRLAQLRLSAVEELADVELSRGRHGRIVADLTAWVVEHPTAQRLAGQLMLALHRSGRSSEAIAVYRRLADSLAADLALEPQDDIAALARAIRRRDPTLEIDQISLPAHASRFIGRRQELDRAASLLGRCRLLTVTGPGGCGKTRLAVKLAGEVAAEHPDGVHLIELAGHPAEPARRPAEPPRSVDPTACESLAARVLAAMGVREAPGETALSSLVHVVAGRRMLLVIDNCEHVRDLCATLLTHLLAECPGLRVLATSRESLGVDGEVLVPLTGMSVSQPDAPLELALRSDAVRLLIDRVGRTRGGGGLRADEKAAAVDLCRRLDGLPLAIELAAARLGTLSLTDLVGRLDQALDLLAGRSPLARHRTMRAAIDWSYELLDPVERTLFARLAVFVGAFDLEAAAAVGADPDRDEPQDAGDVLDPLGRLVERSIVSFNPADDRPYRLIESIRDYAVERLRGRDDHTATHHRHARFYARSVEADPPMDGPAHSAWLARMSAQQDNIRATLVWALGNGKDPELALAVATGMWWYWWVTGQMAEGRSWLARALAAAGSEESPLRAKALRAAAALARNSGDLAEARRLGEASLEAFRALQDRAGVTMALNNLCITAQGQSDFEASLAYGYEALRHAVQDGPARARAAALNNTAGTLRCLGRLDEATEMFSQALDLFRQESHRRGEAAALTNLAVVARRRGRLDESRELAIRFLSYYRQLEIAEGQLDGVEAIAYVETATGRHASALRLLALAERERIRLGAPIFTPDELADRQHAERLARAGLSDAEVAECLAAAANDRLDRTVARLLDADAPA